MNHDLENSMVVGATEAYEAAHKEPYPDWVLDEVCELLGTDLSQWLGSNTNADPHVAKAYNSIYDDALDQPQSMMRAVEEAWRGDAGFADRLMKRLIRTYAEANLSTMIEYFQIDTGENKE
jgi:hypothetical protein